VTNTLLYPNPRAPAMASPSEADFPRPRAAVRATVLRSVFSLAASRKVITPRAWSKVRHLATNAPAGCRAVLVSMMAGCSRSIKIAMDRYYQTNAPAGCRAVVVRMMVDQSRPPRIVTDEFHPTSAPAGCRAVFVSMMAD